jgi:serine/threonine-protein kinase RsbW
MRRFALELPAELPRAAELAAFLEQACAALGLERARRDAIQLCGEEVFVNIALHGAASGPVRVAIALQGDAAAQTLILEDDAPAFDPTAVAEPPPAASLEDATVGGRGLLLVRRFSAAQRYARVRGRNRLELAFRPAAPAAGGEG